jgi:Tol biopolymer transport system component/DNA-binding winged helix-turn-helix (wHTH) protein
METLANSPSHRLQFGSFELDPHSRELRKHGLKVKLPPQAFCLLSCLLEKPGVLVTRDELIRRLWPGDVHVEFEGNLNAITRVLRESLGDSARNPRFIETEPKLGYRFIAPVTVALAPPPPPAPEPAIVMSQPSRHWVVRAALPAVALAVLGLAWRWLKPPPAAAPAVRFTQLTHFLGSAGHPTLSPDGERVAFHWNGDGRGGYNIYIVTVGSDDVRRLTNGPADDTDPAWSPDGRDIAFLRAFSPGRTALMLVGAVGSGERQVADLPKVRSLAWSPDGRWIAYSLASPDNELNPASNGGISALSLSTGRTVELTPSGQGAGDAYPAFSNDGRTLAFVRRSDLWTLPIDRSLKPTGPVRRLTMDTAGALNPVWMPDDKSIVFAAERGAHRKLMRALVDNPSTSPVAVGGEEAFEPAVDSSGRRLVYSRAAVVDSLNVLRLCGAGCTPDPPQKLLYSTKQARNPSYSPDGRQIAFESSRSGHMEIWVCAADGSSPRQLTNLGGPPAGTPNWSPDGRTLVFDARVPAGTAIFSIAASGGAPRQLTTGATEDLVPFWSRDGLRIFFTSKRTGALELWSMSAAGGDAVQITRSGGFRAVESYDGRFLYYTKGASRTAIWRMPVGGGAEEPVIGSLDYWQNFSVTRKGVYFVPAWGSRAIPIHFYDFASSAAHAVGTVEAMSLQGLSASPDNRTLVLSRRESNDRDLMMLELGR